MKGPCFTGSVCHATSAASMGLRWAVASSQAYKDHKVPQRRGEERQWNSRKKHRLMPHRGHRGRHPPRQLLLPAGLTIVLQDQTRLRRCNER